KQPLPLKVQFLGIGFIGTTEVFMYSWPAEHLIHMTHEVAQAAFYILEDNRIMEMWKCLQIIIMRSQKPVTISIPIFLPEVSLSYFSSYLSTVLSYFTTLRVMMEE
ncbi:PREDICTED: uncharacterized protein LOC105460995, partial [Wasmannia auropunctata]|uniref:uncharacterized protein LOC105460995 n=1 Tax=Wasmannia auropunctata TaxID=64793 RepID=UPI0005EFF934